MIKNIIFDVYGILISTGTGSVDAARRIFGKYNITDTAEDVYKKWKAIHKEHIVTLDEFVTEEEIFIKDLERLFVLYGIKDDPSMKIKPMLESLYDRKLFYESEKVVIELLKKFNVAIGSTTDTAPLMSNIRNTSLSRINTIFTSENLKVYKPNEKFYNEILRKTNWKSNECVFVGDSMEDDVIGSAKVGMTSILIDRKEKYKNLPEGIKKLSHY